MNNALHSNQLKQKKINNLMTFVLVSMIILLPILVKSQEFAFISPKITSTPFDTGGKDDFFIFIKFSFLMATILVLSLLFFYKMVFAKYYITRSYVNIPLALLFLAITFSTLFSPYKSIALFGLLDRNVGALTFLGCLILFLIVINTNFKTHKIYWFIYALYPFTLVNTMIGILVFYGYDLGINFTSTLGNRNYISGISSVLMMLFLTLALFDRNSYRRAINLVFSVISSILLFVSMSTSGFLTIVAVMPILLIFIFWQKQKRQILLRFSIFLISFFTILCFMSLENPKVWDETVGFLIGGNGAQEIKEEENIEHAILPTLPNPGLAPGTGRLYIWEKTIPLIIDKLWFGYGLDTYVFHFPQNDPEMIAGLRTSEITVDKPHNMYLGLLYGSGIFAFLSFFILVMIHVIKNVKKLWRKEFNSDDLVLISALFLGWGSYLIQGMFNDEVIGLQPIFWILFGVAVSLLQNKTQLNNIN